MSIVRTSLVSFSLLAAAAGLASAGPTLPLASEQTPPKFVDVTDLAVHASISDAGYQLNINTHVQGVGSDSDAVQFVVMQKKKVLIDKRCPLEGLKDGRARVECRSDGNPLTASGDLTAQLIYIDDQNEKQYLLRDFKLKLQGFTFVGKTSQQVLQDDNLGQAYFWQRQTGDRFDDYAMYAYFWTAVDETFSGKLRCTVDATKLPDIEVSTDSGKVVVEALDNAGKQEMRHKWTQMKLMFDKIYFGKREEVAKHRQAKVEDFKEVRFLGDNPGAWSCDLRREGNVLRTFRFTVGADGRIAAHAASSAPGAPLLRPGVVMVDVRLPAKNAYDLRVRGAAIKGSMAYGMPWPKHDSLKEMLAAAPKDSGFPDPKKGKKGK